MKIMIATLLLFILACTAFASKELTIDSMDYRSNIDAQNAWKPLDDSGMVTLAPEKTPDGKPAAAFRCEMSRVSQRAYWDRALNLDMTGYGKIVFWIKAVGNVSSISDTSLYFSSGNGWYSTSIGLDSNRWQKIIIDRSRFTIEDTPAGWSSLKGVRIAFWKALPRNVTVYVGPMAAYTNDIVVVRNTRGGTEAAPWASNMSNALTAAGIDSVTVDDIDVENGSLNGRKIAIYPHNPDISSKELDALEAFSQSGGRILACYSITRRLADILGVNISGYEKRKYESQFAQMRSVTGPGSKSIMGMPAVFKQDSWNITTVQPVAKNARVLSEWYDNEGKDTGYPAIVISDNGAFISHVLMDTDRANRIQLLRAILGSFDPSLWKEIAQTAQVNTGRLIPRFEGIEAAVRGIEAESVRLKVSEAKKEIAEVRKSYKAYQSYSKIEKWPQALAEVDKESTALTRAYALAQPSKKKEFRAVWCHSAYGVADMTWDEAIKLLKDNGFTAVVPNMLWGGLTDYPSEVLPVNPKVQKDGDQIKLCLAACRKYGIQMHVWKVNWNLGNASNEFVEQMKAEKRTQMSSSGVVEPWLCPSNPLNQKLELDSMLEIVRNYDVDGIHFDYIRYPDSDHCYCDGCRERFQAASGIKVENWPKDVLKNGPYYDAYQQFRRDNITRLVKTVSEGARSINPKIKISAAVFPYWPDCREHIGQDWGDWIKQGYLDFVCPMDYTDSNTGFRARVEMQKKEVNGKIPLYPGIGASAPGLSAVQVIDQVKIAREENVDGFIIFNYDTGTAFNHIPMLGLGTTRKN